jgi:hypothetical protein
MQMTLASTSLVVAVGVALTRLTRLIVPETPTGDRTAAGTRVPMYTAPGYQVDSHFCKIKRRCSFLSNFAQSAVENSTIVDLVRIDLQLGSVAVRGCVRAALTNSERCEVVALLISLIREWTYRVNSLWIAWSNRCSRSDPSVPISRILLAYCLSRSLWFDAADTAGRSNW